MTHRYSITTETWLQRHYWSTLDSFWQRTAIIGTFIGADDTRIETASLPHPNASTSITISPGRAESFIKYKELAYNLYQNGFSVFLLDHRGQGFSERLTLDRQLGYVDEFDFYVDDLKQFHELCGLIHPHEQSVLLCHSMGGCIGLNYLSVYPSDFSKAVMCSPLLGFHTPVPDFIAKRWVKSFIAFNQFWGREASYFFGLGDYQAAPFAHNKLTHSRVRYDLFRQEYEKNPEVKLGGATYEWIQQCDLAIKQLFERVESISTPVLLLQAQQDNVVSNSAQCDFSLRCPSIKQVQIDNARHEILFEEDHTRCHAITLMLDFFNGIEN